METNEYWYGLRMFLSLICHCIIALCRVLLQDTQDLGELSDPLFTMLYILLK
jgi:Na+-transporting NADH:ubiquinone oxidoreductase subunit NqrC